MDEFRKACDDFWKGVLEVYDPILTSMQNHFDKWLIAVAVLCGALLVAMSIEVFK